MPQEDQTRMQKAIKYIKKLFQFIYLNNLFSLFYCSSKINNYDWRNMEDLITYCFSVCGGIIEPFQLRSEILNLIEILEAIRPKYLLEIGTSKGGTLFLFSRVVASDATIISIDLPGLGFFWGYPRWRKRFYKSFAKNKQKIILLRENSQTVETLKKVKSILGDNKLDLLFIDGDHSYEGVKNDFELYSCLVKENGLICFHDIIPGSWGFGVPQFWNEIKMRYEHIEIVESQNQDGFGIGLIKI